MFRFLIFLFVLVEIEAQYGNTNPRSCAYPRLDHGRFRIRQKSKLIKFICSPGYELVGNKYATCRDGEWDVPLPVCVRYGCAAIQIENGVQMQSRGGAWLVFFCLPGYRLVGSSALFCNGRRWNGTAPTCVGTTAPGQLSCDFETPDLCGWTQDELHDFDWRRLNKKTPSSFLLTGPSFDHTLGELGSGYYMYIESTSRLENDTARLVSPIYDGALAKDGCFEFFYHMFGKSTGGLRVFQKPEAVDMQALLQLPEADIQKYTLFEKWGNQGDFWFSSVTPLKDFSDNFQIVIEGIRGKSFTSDIAVDDVAILQGDRCVAAQKAATTPGVTTPSSDSCAGRCDTFGAYQPSRTACGCSAPCVTDGTCCFDFLELCVFDSSTISSDDNSPADLPQTQKLVASTSTSTPHTTKQSTTPTTPSTTITSTTRVTTTKTTAKVTPQITTTVRTTKPIPTSTSTTTTKLPTLVFKTSTAVFKYNDTGRIQKDMTTKPLTTTPTTPRTTTRKVVTITTLTTTPVPFKATTIGGDIDRMKHEEEKAIQANKFTLDEAENTSQSSGLKTAFVTITALGCCVGLVWAAAFARSARGRAALARLRGRTIRDPEVRYLSADVDE